MAADESTSRVESLPGATASLALAAIATASLAVACNIEGERPTLHYSLSSTPGGAAEVDEETGEPTVPPKVQAHIQGALEMLFGTPSEPQFMVLEEWYDDGYDPNYVIYPDGDLGSGEVDEEELEAIFAENEAKTFATTLEQIAAGDFDAVTIPTHMIDLAEYWAEWFGEYRTLQDGVEKGESEASELEDYVAEVQESAPTDFVEWYPSLRESAEMYRQQCLHCHGTEGGGDGSTSAFLNPRPRDYRNGVFKFTGLNNKARPRREDLYRLLEQGATGTAMPSFRRFSRAELEGLVDYVRLLAIRGEVERNLVTTFEFDFAEDGLLPLESVTTAYQDVWEKWNAAGGQLITFDDEIPGVTDELLARGRELYADATTGNCLSCHGDAGRGDGSSAYELEEDGSFQLDENGRRISSYDDDWGHPILPRDITRGIFRGGKRPIDIYRRIYAGINGTPMPGIGEAKDPTGARLLSDEDLWALVHYVRSMTEQDIAEIHTDAGEEHH